MSIELVQVTSRLQAAEKKANEPPPLLLTLQEELSQMKVAMLEIVPLVGYSKMLPGYVERDIVKVRTK